MKTSVSPHKIAGFPVGRLAPNRGKRKPSGLSSGLRAAMKRHSTRQASCGTVRGVIGRRRTMALMCSNIEKENPMNAAELEDAKTLWKMFYAAESFKRAGTSANHILDNKLENEDALFYPLLVATY